MSLRNPTLLQALATLQQALPGDPEVKLTVQESGRGVVTYTLVASMQHKSARQRGAAGRRPSTKEGT